MQKDQPEQAPEVDDELEQTAAETPTETDVEAEVEATEAAVKAEDEGELTQLLEDARSKADEHWNQLMRTRAELARKPARCKNR